MYHYSFLHASKSGIEAQLKVHLLCSNLTLRETFLILQPRKSPFAVNTKPNILQSQVRNATNLLPLGLYTQVRDKFNTCKPRFLWPWQDLVEKVNDLNNLTVYLHFMKCPITTLLNCTSFLCPSVVS